MPTDVEFTNLLAVVAVALAAPLLLGLAPRLRIPAAVLEILGGVALGLVSTLWAKGLAPTHQGRWSGPS